MYKPCSFVYEYKYSSIKTTTLFATNIINSKISNHSRSFYQMSKTIKSYCKYFLLFEAGKLYFFENKITYRRLHSTESISYIKDTCLNRKKKLISISALELIKTLKKPFVALQCQSSTRLEVSSFLIGCSQQKSRLRHKDEWLEMRSTQEKERSAKWIHFLWLEISVPFINL